MASADAPRARADPPQCRQNRAQSADASSEWAGRPQAVSAPAILVWNRVVTSVDIAVIGAGAAGIAAARWLRDNGIRPLVLEARDRVGGRAYTEHSTFGFPVDLGCAWLHSAEQNPWTDLARTQGFTVIERRADWRRRIGAELPSEEHRAATAAALDRNFELIDAAGRAGRDVAVSELVPEDSFRPQFDAIMTWLMGIESDSVSSLDLARYQESDIDWGVAEGLGSVIARAARGLDVHLEMPVRTIHWAGSGVILATSAGEVRARAAIVTLPTTVLAEEGVKFEPALPASIQEALHGVPLGIANKVFLELEPGALPFEGTTHFIGTDKSARTAHYAVRPGGHEVLLAYFGGRFARELERRAELEAFARDELTRVFGSQLPRRIRRTLVTAWSGDPWSLGSYSVARPACARLRERLDEPIGERLYFAGEACSIRHFGTIHGAWESGQRAAERALRTMQATNLVK